MDESADGNGVLPDHRLKGLIETGCIGSTDPVADEQIQPASLDVRLGAEAWRLRASFLPGTGRCVAECAPILHSLTLTEGAVLETGCVYLVRLKESLRLPGDISGAANARSSIGRIDVFTRLVTDGATRFDAVGRGYCGPLYAELSPRTFPVLVREGDRLGQLRLRRGEVKELDRIHISFDSGGDHRGICGYRARRHSDLIDLRAEGVLESSRYWEAVRAEEGCIILDPSEFYILASHETVSVGRDQAAEMTPVAPDLGEFRAHYAGFFDPGFGMSVPARAVLEVRPHDTPFILRDGQLLAYLAYEAMAEHPAAVYGAGRPSYQGQALRLSRHFRLE